jgi:predicted RND superfamily exporter protein
MNRLVRLAARHRRATVAASLALVALAAPGLVALEKDNSAAVFAPRAGALRARFDAFVARFGEPRPVRLVVEGARLFTRAGLDELQRLEDAARATPGVAQASSPAGRALARLELDPELAPAALAAELARDRLPRALGWVAKDGSAASVLIELEPRRGARAAECDAALARLAASARAGLSATVVGGRPLERALDRSGDEVATRFFPLLILFALLLLGATFRDLGGVVVPLVFVGVCEALVLGAIGWAGVRFHLVLALLPPLLFVIALATAVHLAIRCRALEAEGYEAVEATEATYREKGSAVLWVSLSTACGFAALAASDVAPVADLGLWAAVGLGVQLALSFTLYPALLAATAGRRARLPERALETALERLGRRWAEGAARRRGAVFAVYLTLAVAALVGWSRLTSTSDAVAYFAPDHPVRRSLEAAQARGLGASALELELLSREAGAFETPAALARLAALGEELARLPEVASVASAADLVDDVGRASPWAELATPAELSAQALAFLAEDDGGRAALARFLSTDGAAARVALFVPIAGYETLAPVAEAAEAMARRAFPEADVAATGVLRLVLEFHRSLLATLGLSMALTLPALAAVFFVLLRGAKEVVKALVPNVWPVVVLLGGMGWLGVPLDLATVMVASIVLGLAVDDTIHTLAHYREEAQELGARRAVCLRIERTAPAYLLTGAILCAGFGVCALSDFEPIARFGQLAAVAIALAVVSDLILIPALFGGAERRAPSPAPR